MIKFVEFFYENNKELIQIGDIRKISPIGKDRTRIYFTDGTYTVTTLSYERVCERIREALT